jgi:hypothetical protein
MWGLRPDFYYCQTVACLLIWGALFDERTGLPFTVAAGPRQHSNSWVWVPRDSWPYYTVSDSRLPQPGGPAPRIYIPQEQGVPGIPPGIRCSFRRFLRLAGLRWRYSNPPPRGVLYSLTSALSFITRGEPKRDHNLLLCFIHCYDTCVNLVVTLSFLQAYLLLRNALLASRCLAIDHSFTI